MIDDQIDTEPAEDWAEDGHHSADMLGRVLLTGMVTCAVLAAVGIAGFLWGAW